VTQTEWSVQCSISRFPRSIRSHAHRCSCLTR